MFIVKTEGIDVSKTFPDSPPPASDDDPDQGLPRILFNDLEIVAGLPLSLNVIGIRTIIVYTAQGNPPHDHVVGIETVYVLDTGKLSPPVVHGRKTQYITEIKVHSQERVIAAFVGIEKGDSTKKIKALRFTKTNVKTGAVVTQGYVATPTLNYIYDAAFGEIVAFHGTKSRGGNGRLVAIGVQSRYLG